MPTVNEHDVIVVGGSPSGVAAAICAAREGASVLIVERNCFLGGQSVATMVVQWEKRAFINNLGAVATRGIAKEMIDRIIALGGSDTLWEGPPGCEEMRGGEEYLDVEAIKITLLRMCLEEKIDILFDTLLVDVVMDQTSKDPKVNGIVIENKSGRQSLTAKVIVDATAYLDVVWHAVGDEGVIVNNVDQRMGAGCYIVFGGVDSSRFIEYVLTEGKCFGYPAMSNPEKVKMHLKTHKMLKYEGFVELLDEAYDKGILDGWPEDVPLPRLLKALWWTGDRWCSPIDYSNKVDALDGWSLSRAEINRQLIDWKMFEIFKLIPGWENAYISRTSFRIGLRETRSLKAVTMLNSEDIFNPNHKRADVVGRSGGHDPGKNKLWKAYPIPYGIMIPEKLNGVICCTRTIGAGDNTALNAHRGITPTIVVGQAAGTAAALAVASNVEPRDVNIKKLQEILRKNDVVLDVETVELDTIPDSY
ncbi:MAG: FAD-dependent oxidoreductase [Candidatus Hodarchaeota archaeon]